jgi:phthiocerol/phenolphthiocerol synthesis type-I polyketide synthase D
MATPDPRALQFSLMFFAASDDALLESRYELIFESARFADSRGFTSVWVPERHFTDFGCLYPNPAVLHAALARETRNLQLRAGSVVIPLHDPLRIAEEWAMVDNLSGGRVGISAATGWNPNDFAFFPDRYANRRDEMYRGLATVRSLWRGEALRVKNGIGETVELRIHPKPIQRELPLWLTAAGSPETFIRAGEMGLNVLTHLLDHDVDDIAQRIALYREARAAHGWDPDAGEVTVMLHTFVGEDDDTVREEVRGPYTRWLQANAGLLKGLAANRGESVDVDALSMADKAAFANFIFERFYASRALMGTPQTCMRLVERLQGVGATEIACLLDFGPRAEVILAHLPHLHALAEHYRAQAIPDSSIVPALREQARAQLRERTKPRTNAGSTPSAPPRGTLDDVRARCVEEISSTEFYERLARSGAQFGPKFRGIERIWRRDGEALAEVRQARQGGAPAGGGVYPPFLDACLQVFAAALPRDLEGGHGDAVYLPVGLGSFTHRKPVPSQVFSHAVLRSYPRGKAEQLEGDIEVLDASGDCVCEVRGFRVQRTALDAPLAEDPVGRWFYRVEWRAKELQAAAAPGPGTWVVLVDDLGIGDALATMLEDGDDRCVRVGRGAAPLRMDDGSVRIPPADAGAMKWVLDNHGADPHHPLKGIVHLWSLDAEVSDAAEPASLELTQRWGVDTILGIVQVLAAARPSTAARLWVATRGAQPVADPGPEPSPAQSLVWGFGKTIAVESPALWGGLVDLDAGAPEESARQLAQVLHGDRSEPFIGVRNGRTFVPRLVSQPETPHEPPALAWTKATYLVTGGLGGLGMETARWLVDRGARYLVLLGRHVPQDADGAGNEQDGRTSQQLAALQELRARGVEFDCVAADVADRAQLTAAIDRIEARGWPPLRGVVHAAGIGRPEKLVDLTPEAMAEVLRPKVLGAWALHHAVAGRPLDFFVMYSSATHQLGILGQGVAAYSAANAFLDGLAHLRTRRGEPALTICWGPWARVGMAARTGNDHRLRSFGIEGIEPEPGLRALGHLLGTRRAEAWVISVDWAKLFEADADLSSAPFVSDLRLGHAAGESEEVLAVRQALLATLRQAPVKLRRDLMLAHIQQHAMAVMRLDSRDAVDWRRGLFDIGMDSLMALELKNRLQASLGLSIPSTLAFTYPDVHAISGYLVQRMFPEAAPATAATQADAEIEQRVQVATTQIQDLDESEMESLLARKVESL